MIVRRFRVLALGVSFALLLPACAPTLATPAVAPAPVGVETITATDIHARIAFLASDALRGRDTPSPGLEAAAAYVISEHLRLGLEPAGTDGFYQRWPFPLRRIALDGTRLVLHAGGVEQAFLPGRDYFVAGGTTEDLAAALVWVGRDVEAPGVADVLRDGIAVTALPGGFTQEFRMQRARQVERARAAGARAVIHVLDPGWTADSIAEFGRRSALPGRTLGEAVAFPQVHLSYEAAGRLFRAGGTSLDEAWRQVASGAVRPLTLAGVTATAGLPVEFLERAYPPNVVAVVRGSDPVLRDEYVVLSAHLDHVGVGRPVDGDSIYNGADDNASGSAALLEIAQALSSDPARPRRSVIILHVSGEEKGLLGSRWFAENPTVPIESIVANVNIDMIGRNAPDSVVVIGKDYSSLGPLVEAIAARHPELGMTVADDLWPEQRFFFRSDHFNFARREIPALFFFTGVHEDYHRPGDTVDRIDAEKTARITRLIYHLVREIADDPRRPEWVPEGLEEVRRLTR
jgi:hypothetical protein